ncbi:hypothetical protein EJ02DRAFT_73229 [Clathrospora elynae]|uniref:Uncharacterized protein n=1 Tax=Clathrospora elynae TaxID=706981 RepID=A0A6A5SZW5_9PLEO|nr:hypothetical protein EJ02DRAFT_73229 [Clathrospora elynae]
MHRRRHRPYLMPIVPIKHENNNFLTSSAISRAIFSPPQSRSNRLNMAYSPSRAEPLPSRADVKSSGCIMSISFASHCPKLEGSSSAVGCAARNSDRIRSVSAVRAHAMKPLRCFLERLPRGLRSGELQSCFVRLPRRRFSVLEELRTSSPPPPLRRRPWDDYEWWEAFGRSIMLLLNAGALVDFAMQDFRLENR